MKSLITGRDIKFCSDTQGSQSLGEHPKLYFLFLYCMDLCLFLPTIKTHKNYFSSLKDAASLLGDCANDCITNQE